MSYWISTKTHHNVQCCAYKAILALTVLVLLQPVVVSVPLSSTHQQPVVTEQESRLARSPAGSKKKSSTAVLTPETSKVLKTEDSNVYCFNNHSTSTESMTIENLKQMINTVEIIFGSLPSHETYVTTDYGVSLFQNQDAAQAYHSMFNWLENNHLPTPENIWTTQSPCLHCANRIIDAYDKPDFVKPNLRIASIYTGDSLLDTVDSLRCMAKMVHLNFTIEPWDWTHTRNIVDNTNCSDSIDSALQNTTFSDKQEKLQSLIDFVYELSLNPLVNSWCSIS